MSGTAARRVVIALDIDGVVIPPLPVVPSEGPLQVRPRRDVEDTWDYRWVPHLHFGSLVPVPVISLLQDLHEAPHVEPHWHSSWWVDAWDINVWMGMPRWPMLGTEGEFLRDEQHLPGRTLDWKTNSILQTLETLGPEDKLVWIEDEIEFFLERDKVRHLLDADPRLVMIQPNTYTGIASNELRQIRDTVTM